MRETQDSLPLQCQGYKQSSKLSQLQNTQLNLLTVTFLVIFKVNSDKPVLTFRQWKSKTGKELTITANFQQQNLGTALSGEKNPDRGLYGKKLDCS